MSHNLDNEEDRTVKRAGRTLVLYIPKEAKRYIRPGDSFKVSSKIVDGEMQIVARKKIFNFSLGDLKVVSEEQGLEVKYDGEIEGTRIVDYARDRISLKSIQSKFEEPYSLVHATLSAKIIGVSPHDYQEKKKLVDSFKSQYDIFFVPEGDANTVKLLEHPEYYVEGDFDLFDRLEKSNKKIDASIVIRLDNMRNSIDDVIKSFHLVQKLEQVTL
ncbi:MAG: hypothetical protein ACYC7D_08575 [Nitrososphaerales archaeon]